MRFWHLLGLLFVFALASFLIPQPSPAQPVIRPRDPFASIPMWMIWEKRERRGSRRAGGAAPAPLRLKDLRRPGVSFGILRPGAASQRHIPASRGPIHAPGVGDARRPFDSVARPWAFPEGYPPPDEQAGELTTTLALGRALSPPHREAGIAPSLPPPLPTPRNDSAGR
jgi:hypothetical protein